MPPSFKQLLQFIDTNRPNHQVTWNGATLEKIDGGANNLIYRVKAYDYDYAVKLTIKDERYRARREFVALRVLREFGLELAPESIWLDEDNFSQPIVVQTWITGQPLKAAPKDRQEWLKLIAHFCSIHSIKKKNINHQLEDAFFNFRNGPHGKAHVFQGALKLPLEAKPPLFDELLNWFETWEPPSFSDAQLSLCRVDPNWRNFILQENQFISVDWENSGWGDPAFEIADLMTHPAYDNVHADDWAFIVDTYARETNDVDNIIRIKTYYVEMLMWWVIRYARYLYEIPRGLDKRLAKRPHNWKQDTERKLSAAIEKLKAYIAEQ